MSALLVPLTIGHAQSASTAVTERQSPVRRPAVSSLGTLAFEQDGHLYFRFADGTTTRVSAGTAYHRDASFTSGALYFASDSAGTMTSGAFRSTGGIVPAVPPPV